MQKKLSNCWEHHIEVLKHKTRWVKYFIEGKIKIQRFGPFGPHVINLDSVTTRYSLGRQATCFGLLAQVTDRLSMATTHVNSAHGPISRLSSKTARAVLAAQETPNRLIS
jgi:hypothetical protein